MLRSRLLGILAVTALLAGACAPAAGAPTWTYTPGNAAAATTPTPSQGQAATGDVLGTLEVHAVDLGFEPNALSVAKAGTYEVLFKNQGALPHNITFADGTVGAAAPGEAVTVKVNVPDSGLTFLGSTAGSGGSNDHGGPAPVTDVAPDPKAPPPVLYPPEAPKLLPGTVHDIDLVIQEKLMTVAYDPKLKEGFVQAVWTFGGTVPGPAIRVKVGD